MGILPTVFRSGSGSALANYDWYDFSSGTGYKSFYACGMKTSTATIYALTSNKMDGDQEVLQVGANNNTVEYDFDITFQKPTYISGTVYINWTQEAAAGRTVQVAFTFYHVDLLAAETSIGTVTGDSSVNGGGAAARYRKCTKASLTGKNFGVGETLRVTAAVTGSGGAGTVQIGCDPEARVSVTEDGTSATIGWDTIFQVPFRVDL
jgi:hypothetical protein